MGLTIKIYKMKKFILTIAFIATGLVASAQVGIGNTDPKVSLQVDKSADALKADGVLVPRVTVAELNTKAATYGADQNGSLVFVTAITGAANETSDVTATGFHYYNSTTDKWVPIVAAAQPYQNIVGAYEENSTSSRTVGSNTYLFVSLGGVATTLTLPTTTQIGKTIWVKNQQTSGSVTVNGAVTINGSRSRCFVWSGSAWEVLAF